MTNPKRKSSIISLKGFLKRSATKFIHNYRNYIHVSTDSRRLIFLQLLTLSTTLRGVDH